MMACGRLRPVRVSSSSTSSNDAESLAPGVQIGQQRADVAEQLRFELGLAGAHPVAVAVDGVDLAVVGEHAQRLRERPRRERVGRVAGVHDGELGGEPLVLQVGVERLELERGDHALVPERARGERHEVRAELESGALAQPEHAAIERDARQRGCIADRGPCDEELLELRPRVEGQLAEVRLLGRHLAPAEHDEVLRLGDVLDARLLRGALLVVAGQEDHARGVLADGRKLEVDDRAQERVGHLGQDARAVAGAGIRADRTAVLEVAERRQREVDDVVTGHASKRGDHGQAAGVLLERRVVHSLLLGKGAEGAVTWARSHVNRPHVEAQMGRRRPSAECRYETEARST